MKSDECKESVSGTKKETVKNSAFLPEGIGGKKSEWPQGYNSNFPDPTPHRHSPSRRVILPPPYAGPEPPNLRRWSLVPREGATLLTSSAAHGELGHPAGQRCPPFTEAGVRTGQWASEAAEQWPIRTGFACRAGNPGPGADLSWVLTVPASLR